MSAGPRPRSAGLDSGCPSDDHCQDGIVNHNPLLAREKALADVLDAERAEAAGLREALAWYDHLDAESVVADAELHGARLKHELSECRDASEVAEAKARRLRPLTWAWLYPPAFLASAAVRRSRREYREAKATVATCAAQVSTLEAEYSRAVFAAADKHDEADRHRQFDRPAAEARLDEVEAAIANTTPVHEALASRAAVLDEKLGPVVSELERAARDLATLRRKLELARGYMADLDRAADGRARYKIHQATESDLGTGKPSRFINENRGNHDRLERTVKKLEERVRDIVRHEEVAASARKLVVDGSNLCHAGPKKLGLFALRAQRPHLLDGREVIIIFDQSITGVLGIDEPGLRSQLHGAEVHIVGGTTRADKLILQLSADAGTYAVSNDTFSDYPEMHAIKSAKRIHVELLDDRVIIEDLDINVKYSRTR